MQYTIATIAAFAASYVAASPCAVPVDTTIVAGNVFHIMSIRSGSDIQYSSMQATKNGFYLNEKSQGSVCYGDGNADTNYASMYLTAEGALYLNTAGNPTQQVYVDRSTEGQGAFGYTTGAQAIGAHQERGPFSVVDGNLVFVCGGDNPYSGFLACPDTETGGYTVHLDTGLTSPSGLTGCVSFVAKALKEDSPIQCLYSEATSYSESSSSSYSESSSSSYSESSSGSYSKGSSGSYSEGSDGSYKAASTQGSYEAAPTQGSYEAASTQGSYEAEATPASYGSSGYASY